MTMPVILRPRVMNYAIDEAADLTVNVFMNDQEVGRTTLTLYVLRGSAHCHNMATTRHDQWERIEQWLWSVV